MKTFKTFYGFMWKYKNKLFTSLFFGMLAAVFLSVPPFLYKYFVNNLKELNTNILFTVIAVFFIARIGSILSTNLSFYFGDYTLFKSARDARITIFSHLQNLDFAFHVNKKSGEFISRIKRGDSAFIDAHYEINSELIHDIFNFIIVVFTFSFINKNLALVFIFFIVLNMIASVYFLKKNMLARQAFNNEEDNVSHLIVDNLINYETVKYFSKEKREIKNLAAEFKLWFSTLWKYSLTFRRMSITTGGILTFAIVLILYIAGKDVIQGNLTPGDFALTFGFILQFFPRFENLTKRMRHIVKFYADLKNYLDILDYPLVMSDSENPTDIKNDAGNINFKKVSFAYPSGREALYNVNFTVPEGSKTALVGRSGSGKTTITKLMLRMYDPGEGAIEINGIDLKNLRKEDLRKMIGVVPQEPILFNNTIFYNISYPLDEAHREEIIAAAKLANLHDFIESLPNEYDTVVGERGVKLSGGQKQRLAIARVFLLNPPIIIFDEATSHLDSESEKLIQESIEWLSRNKTLIIIAHRLSTVMKADKIIVLDKGKIKETGIHSELIEKQRGIYKLLWNLQTEGAFN